MAQKGNIEKKEGVVIEALPNTLFRVKLDDGRELLCYLAGKMRMYRIRILIGDKVDIEVGTDDDGRGRIVYRYK